MVSFLVDKDGYYGEFGGAYVPEILHRCVEELQKTYLAVLQSKDFKQEYDRLLRDYVDVPHRSTRHGVCRKVRLPDLPETGRPESYRRTQNQQYHRADSAGTPYGQTPHHSRNRCRTARRCHRHRMCIDEYGVHCIYGQDRCGTPARQRREDERCWVQP